MNKGGYLFFVLLIISSCSKAPKYDIVIINGTVYDDSGSEPSVQDIGINGAIVEKIGKLSSSDGKVAVNTETGYDR